MSRYEFTNGSNNRTTGGGIGFISLLQIVFITLKLCHVIDWSWIWVLAPYWITMLLFCIVIVIVVGYEVHEANKSIKKNKDKKE